MLFTDKQTDRQTNATKNITSFAKEVMTSTNPDYEDIIYSVSVSISLQQKIIDLKVEWSLLEREERVRNYVDISLCVSRHC